MPSRAAAEATEVARIRTHLAYVEPRLRASDLCSLTPAQRANRDERIEEHRRRLMDEATMMY